MKWNKKFVYPASIRSVINGGRHYDINDTKLPSVTTILQATQSDEKMAILAKWKQKVGEKKADQIRDDAAARGTVMHRIIEGYVTGEGHVDLSPMGQAAGLMAQIVFKEGLKGRMDEVWGSEITLYYPDLYAGATDLVGVYEGRPANHVYDTKIQSGVILMCTKNNYFQKFVVKDKEFQRYMWEWVKRVDLYLSRT